MPTVLVLQDDPTLRFAITRALKDRRFAVVAVETPKAALAFLRHVTPDILILELLVDGQLCLDVANYAAVARPKAQVVFTTASPLFARGEIYDLPCKARALMRHPLPLAEMVNLVQHIAEEVHKAT